MDMMIKIPCGEMKNVTIDQCIKTYENSDIALECGNGGIQFVRFDVEVNHDVFSSEY